MTKSKKNLAIMVALITLLVALGSLFATFGVFAKPTKTVEAATLTEVQLAERRKKPGLYQYGTMNLVSEDFSWENMIKNGKISVTDGHLEIVDKTLEGDLVCGEVSGLTSLYEAFRGAQKLTGIDITNLNTNGITNVSENTNCAIAECYSLKNIIIGNNFDLDDFFMTVDIINDHSLVESVTIGDNFGNSLAKFHFGFPSLKEITIGKNFCSNATSFESLFSEIVSMESLDLSGLNTSKITNFNEMFAGSSFNRLVLGENFIISDNSETDSMFSLYTPTIKNSNTDFSDGDWADIFSQETLQQRTLLFFMKLTGASKSDIETIVLPKINKPGLYRDAYLSLTISTINEIVCPTIIGNKKIPLAPAPNHFYALADDSTKAEVTELSSATNGKILKLYESQNPSTSSKAGLFKNGKQIKTWNDLLLDGDINIKSGVFQVVNKDLEGDLVCSNVRGLVNLSKAFNGCSKLTSIDCSNFDISQVTTMNSMFLGCSSLTSLDVSNWNTAKVTDFAEMFAGTKLNVLDISNFDFSSVSNDPSAIIGMLGINDIYCQGVLGRYTSSLVPVYQMAMQNQDISTALNSVSSSLASAYSSAIAGKTEDEVGYLGRVYIVGAVINQMLSVDSKEALIKAQTWFDTKIGTIYAPANAISLNISLPYNTNYVYLSGGTKTALPNQLLYGYKDIDSNLTELALFEGELDKPATKPSETSETGIVADISMIIIALASVINLAVVATKKKRIAR